MSEEVEAAKALYSSVLRNNQQLRTEIEAKEARITKNEGLLQHLSQYLAEMGHGLPESQVPPPLVVEVAREAMDNGKKSTSLLAIPPEVQRTRVELLQEVLREAGYPLSVAQMRAPMRKKGYGKELTDATIYNSIYTALSKKEGTIFRKYGGNLWGLADPKWHEDMEAEMRNEDDSE